MPTKKYSDDEDGLPLVVRTSDTPDDRLFTALLASVVASLATLNFGYALGFTSPTEILMTTDGSLSKDAFSWFSVSSERNSSSFFSLFYIFLHVHALFILLEF